MDQLRSPMEITTLFLVFSIGVYVLIFWRSQLQAKQAVSRDRRRTHRPQHPRRRVSDRGDLENMVLNHLFEDDERERHHVTNH